ncbi:MAG: hypothetical protein WCV50_06820 [Patescibacteria group bacterium]|jgi:hypothetical protein
MSGSDDGDDHATGVLRTNSHHTLPKSRIRALNRARFLKRSGRRQISQERHGAYHNLFFNAFPWEVVKRLKGWKKELEGLRPALGYFYEHFSLLQMESFQLLFSFEPGILAENGNLSRAVRVIKAEFFAPVDVFQEYVSLQHERAS